MTTGAFYENNVDLHVNGPLPIEVRRTYSSLNTNATNEFGFGWLPGYAPYLVCSGDPTAAFDTIQAADTDGSIIVFRLQPGSNTVWSPTVADNPNLTNTSGGTNNFFNSTIVQSIAPDGTDITYQWKLPDGSVRNYLVESFPATVGGFTYVRQRPYLTSWVDNRGNSLTFNYVSGSNNNGWGHIDQIVSSNGSSVNFTYDANGHILQAAANDGRTVNYTYNTPGDLVQVQLPDQSIVKYQYGAYSDGDSNHLITQVTKPANRILQNSYDVLDRVTQQMATVDESDLALTATFDYSVPGQTTTRDAYGNITVDQYNTNGLLTKITDPLGQKITQAWYSTTGSGGYVNSLQTVTDKRGLVTNYQYDAQGNTTQTQVTGNLTGDGTSQTATTTSHYNSLNQPTSVTDASGITTNYYYSDSNNPYLPTQISTSENGHPIRTDLLAYSAVGAARGLLLSKTVASGSSDQAITTYSYNSAGLMTQQIANTGTGGAGSTDPNVITNYTYTTNSELGTVTDADKRSTTYTYDGMSRPASKTVKDENGNILGAWTMTYTSNGELSETTGPHTSPANTVQRYYDDAGNLAEKVVALSQARTNGGGVTPSSFSAVTDYVYDDSNNLVWEMDPKGNETTMTYDANGQMLTKSTPALSGVEGAGLRNESYQYEPGGKVSQYTNPLGGITNYYYTSTGQLSKQVNPDGSVLQWRYQTDGRLSQEILRNGSVWTTVYDDTNRIVTRTFTNADGMSATERSVFDRRGNLISYTDADGYTKNTTFDGLNRVKLAVGPATLSSSKGQVLSAQQTTTYFYGASAKVVTTQNALGEKTVATSDALGRPVETQVFDSGGHAVRTTTYAYSADNNSVTETDGTGAGAISHTTWTDTLDQPVLTVLGDGTFTSNSYDSDGNLLSATDALGQTTGYGYNGLNQMTSQTLPALSSSNGPGTVTNFTYDAAGNQLTRAMADGTLTQQQAFDAAGRKTSEELFSGASITRSYSYSYYSTGPVGLLETVTGPRDTVTTTYDDFLRPYMVSTLSLPNGSATLNSTTNYTYDNRNHVTSILQYLNNNNAADPATEVDRAYDGYGQLLNEILHVTINNTETTFSNVTQTWDAAGRRASLTDASSSLGTLFTYAHRADDLLTQVAVPGSLGSGLSTLDYSYAYADNGLLSSRTNSFRTLNVDTRDAVGRITGQTETVGATNPLVENMTWRANGTLNTYTATRTGTGAWNESRAYTYDSRGQLLSEGFTLPSSPSPLASSLNYSFDGNNPGLGVRLDAKVGTGAPAAWEASATPNSLGQVTTDQIDASAGGAVSASGPVSFTSGMGQVNILVDGVSQGPAAISGNTWSADLDLAAGSHTLTATAVDPSGLSTATASSTFTVNPSSLLPPASNLTSAYDGEGNVISRTWANGTTQSLTWDAQNRLIQVSQRDSSQNGYDWTAIYDGLGRRLVTSQQAVADNTASGSPTVAISTFDPQVEFLEIGINVNGAQAWKVYGPDMDGVYGGLQGTGGLEAVVMDSGGAATGVLNDFWGNGVATISGGSVTWNPTHVGGYGPLPDSAAQPLTSITQLASAVSWRGHYIDPTGFYNLGARYYEPNSGRFLSCDPMSFAAGTSLYALCNGDPVNSFDPDGRCNDSSSSAPQFLDNGAGPGFGSILGNGSGTPDPTWWGQNSQDPNNGWQGVPYKYDPNSAAANPNPYGVYPNNTGVSITTTSDLTINPDGSVTWGVGYNVPPNSNGVVVQQITAAKSLSSSGTPDSGNFNTSYYEGWSVANGSVTPSNNGTNDNFSFSAPATTNSAGTEAVTGAVQFYPNATMADFPELHQGGSPYAGILPSSTTQPANWVDTGALPHDLSANVTPQGINTVSVPSTPYVNNYNGKH